MTKVRAEPVIGARGELLIAVPAAPLIAEIAEPQIAAIAAQAIAANQPGVLDRLLWPVQRRTAQFPGWRDDP